MKPPSFDNSYARLPAQFFEPVIPDHAPNPKLIVHNSALAREIGFDSAWLHSKAGLAMISGQKMPNSANPIAMVYGGHQFGHWSGRLGDGRACLLGEIVGPDNIRRDIVLKGSGPTPYSRRGDGKSELGPVLREYIVSEAMAAYGVPTTRALAALTTGENVVRGETLPGGVLVRVAKSHVRVGTFQHFYADRDIDGLKTLTDY
ncbi:MAG: YdiU family protein, partial [Robiginitomaculum sp.]|nr:YdiU family protein [Robiginitomaculum sp.]